ncbi:glutathione-regulated potassium-efflux system ancillary protein KefG [Seinonella peptonophila]|uniref:Glutathione-regulated potassium-efflux system ancillary protein KefG n=1 Tax=Seinonella peptonophila TaxID=112248 RepID=A0A1M5A558_9BACL|nr:NAD(P)H-dependent oxidoreductase [Seinonella peptonophila]SHF25408.1 glutathione-regulated potassium-efflux system ancillary protein KefG [Seinonella peptonophila]
MKVLVIVAHPNLSISRGNRQRVIELEKIQAVTIHQLYQEYPHWTINVEKEQQLLLKHDRIVLQFPFYWYSCPPLLKKWFDDVLTYGWAYGKDGDKLKGKEFIVAITSGGAKDAYRAGAYDWFTIDEYLKPIQATITRCQGTFLPSYTLYGIDDLTNAEIRKDAQEYGKYIIATHRHVSII